jgi:hypothetical protein
MKEIITIMGISVECSWMGYRILCDDEVLYEKVGDYLVSEGFLTEDKVIV